MPKMPDIGKLTPTQRQAINAIIRVMGTDSKMTPTTASRVAMKEYSPDTEFPALNSDITKACNTYMKARKITENHWKQ